jgi:hypothetical protein
MATTTATDWSSVPIDHGTAAGDCTVFARNLAYSVTDEVLEQTFEDIGPIKRAFVVTEKGAAGKSRGYGFVQFAVKADAERAVASLQAKQIDGRPLKLEMAGTRHSAKFDPIERKVKPKTAIPTAAAATAAAGGAAAAGKAAPKAIDDVRDTAPLLCSAALLIVLCPLPL